MRNKWTIMCISIRLPVIFIESVFVRACVCCIAAKRNALFLFLRLILARALAAGLNCIGRNLLYSAVYNCRTALEQLDILFFSCLAHARALTYSSNNFC